MKDIHHGKPFTGVFSCKALALGKENRTTTDSDIWQCAWCTHTQTYTITHTYRFITTHSVAQWERSLLSCGLLSDRESCDAVSTGLWKKENLSFISGTSRMFPVPSSSEGYIESLKLITSHILPLSVCIPGFFWIHKPHWQTPLKAKDICAFGSPRHARTMFLKSYM